MSDVSIIIKSSDFISNIDQLHNYSIWKLCYDELGTNIIKESTFVNFTSGINILDLNLDLTKDYYLFVKYIGNLSVSDWSSPICIQFKQKEKIDAIKLDFRQCHSTSKSLNSYLDIYFENTQIDVICNYNDFYYVSDSNLGVCAVGGSLLRSKTKSSEIQTKLMDFVILEPNTTPIFSLQNIFKPKKIFIKGYFVNQSNCHYLMLRFTGNRSKKEYFAFALINVYGSADCPDESDAFYCDNMNTKLDLITNDKTEYYFEYEITSDQLQNCFIDQRDEDYTLDVLAPHTNWRENGAATIYSGQLFLTQLNLYSENYTEPQNKPKYRPFLKQYTVPFTSDTLNLLAVPYSSDSDSADKISFKISKDKLGTDIIVEHEQKYNPDFPKTLLFEYSENISYDVPYYGFVRYHQLKSGYTDWSLPVKFILCEPIITKSERRMYRHWTDCGSVLETTVNGVPSNFIVLDSYYRNTSGLAFGSYGSSVSLPLVKPPSTKSEIGNTSSDDFNSISLPAINDTLFDSYWYNPTPSGGYYNGYDSNTAFYNCNIWMNKEGTSDGSTSGVPIVRFCRNISVSTIKCDLPNINQLIKIFIESETIDLLEELHVGNTQSRIGLFLGRRNPNGFCMLSRNSQNYGLISSTQYTDNYNLQITSKGRISFAYRSYSYYSIVPISEEFNFKLNPSINRPVFTNTFNNKAFNIDENITFTSSKFTSNVNQSHLYSNWKLCSDELGNDIIIQDNKSSDLTSHLFDLSNITLTENVYYYVFVQYSGTYYGNSDWSLPVKVIYSTNIITTKCGRKLYRHPSNMGSVMEYAETTGISRVLILDAKYRYRGYKFGTYGTDTSLSNYNLNGYVDGLNHPNTEALPIVTDATINSSSKISLPTATSKNNCDVWMTYVGKTDTQGTIGCPPVEHCRNINVDGISCNLPNCRILYRIYLECEEIDKLDPTINEAPTLAIGGNESANRFETGAFSSDEASNNNVNILFYNSAINAFGKNVTTRANYGNLDFITIPILELSNVSITLPVISIVNCNDVDNPNCKLYIKSSAFSSIQAETHIKTHIKIYKSNNDCIYESYIDSTKLTNDDTLTDFYITLNSSLFEDDQQYYLILQYEGSTKSYWSASRQFKYSKKVFITESNRKLYRHSSDKGTVVEFLDKNVKRRVIVLDAKYRTVKQFGTYLVTTPVPTYNYNNSNNNRYINGSSAANPTTNIGFTDSSFNIIWQNVDSYSSKDNCDIWMTYNMQTDSQKIVGVPAVAYCRSLNVIDGCVCDLPNFQTLARILIEASNIDDLDPTANDYPNYLIGRKNKSYTFPGTTVVGNYWTSTCGASNLYITAISSSLNQNTVIFRYQTLGVIPIIEITDIDRPNLNVISSSLIKTETNYRLSFHYSNLKTFNSSTFQIECLLLDELDIVLYHDDGSNSVINQTAQQFEIKLPLSLNLDQNKFYFIKFRLHFALDNIKSEFTDKISVEFAKSVNGNLPSGRKLYRHKSGMGSVLEFIDNGVHRKVLVLDAKYRSNTNLRFGLYQIDVGLPNTTTAFPKNIYGSQSIVGLESGLDSLTSEFPIISDFDLENKIAPPRFDTLRSKDNCDSYMKFSTQSTVFSSYGTMVGSPPVIHCRNIEIDGSKCDLPNINTLLRIVLESDNIDNLDPTADDYPTQLLGVKNPNGRFQVNKYCPFVWSSTIQFRSTAANTGFGQGIFYFANEVSPYSAYTWRYSGYAGHIAYSKQIYGIALPILELIEDAIEQPSIIIIKTKDNSKLIAKSSPFVSKMTEDHICTSWKICSDKSGNDIVQSSLNDSNNLLEFSFDVNLLTADTPYFIFVQYQGSYTQTSLWSTPYKLIFNNDLFSESGRLLYRHESNEGTVLEYTQFGKRKKILILDGKYRFGGLFGLENVNTILSKIGHYNNNNNWVIDGTSAYNLNTTDCPIVTDFQIEEVWPKSSFDSNTPRQNGDILMHYDTTKDSKSNVGPIAVMKAREIVVSNMHAEIPTINELYPISLELKNIDSFDESLVDYPTHNLFPKDSTDKGMFFEGSAYPYIWASSETLGTSNVYSRRCLTNTLQLSYTNGGLYNLSNLPIIDISDEFINKAEIIYSSGYVLNGSNCVFVKTRPSIPTNSDQIIGSVWKVCLDSAGNNIIQQDEQNTNSTIHHFKNVSLTHGDVYYVFVKFKYVLFDETEWSEPSVFVFSKFGTPGGRKLYRHKSDMGSVLEYYDTSWKKMIILDALYRKFSQLSTSNCSASKYYSNINHTQLYPPYIKYKGLITGLDESYIYSEDALPIQMSDSELNALWPNSMDSQTAKQNCDRFASLNAISVKYTRSILIDGVGCDIPNIQQMMRIYVEADFIDSLDPTVDSNLDNALGLKNPNGFWGKSYGISSTLYSSSQCRQVGYLQGVSYVAQTLANCFVIPILEV